LNFQKQYGSREEMEDVILTKRRHFLEEELKSQPLNYDTWFDYTRLEEQSGNVSMAREVYERAI
jgi:crooked neck